jgi:F-type H+-transporting ATPase subunit a
VEHHPFTWLWALSRSVPSLGALPEHALGSIVVTALLIGVAIAIRGQLVPVEETAVPGDRLSLRLVVQYFVEAISNLAEGVIGHHASRHVPLLGSLFLFILVSNLLGLVPGFASPTSNFSITLALGTVSFLAYNWHGFREHGAGYLRQFLGPVIFLAPLMLVVELFSHAFRPLSLAIRLFANMFADHMVVEKFTDLTYAVVPVVFYALGAFVAVIQAFVFTMLTAIYIALAVSHEH